MTLEQFKKIVKKAEKIHDPHAANAMLLALVTGQRIADVVSFKFSDVKNDYLCLVQEKTGTPMRMDIDLRLDAMNLSIRDLIKRCRSSSVASKYMVHHTKNYGNAPRGSKAHKQTVSKMLTKCVRVLEAEGELKWPDGKNPATFREIRSLAAREYEEEFDAKFSQKVLGHKDVSTTAIYIDGRGDIAVEVKAPKKTTEQNEAEEA